MRRIELEVLGLQALVILGHLLRFGELRTELIEQHGRRDAAHRELLRLVEEAATVDRAVDVGIKKDQEFLVEISGGLAFHVVLLWSRSI